MPVEYDVRSQLIASLPYLGGHPRMVVRPGVPDVTGVIIGDDAAVHYPGQGIGPAMGGDVRKEGDGKGNPVDGVIEGNPDVG